MLVFIRGKLRPESENPVVAHHPGALSAGAALLSPTSEDDVAAQSRFSCVTFPLVLQDRQPVHAALYRRLCALHATSLPGISITQASQLLQEQDRIIRSFPEVERVFGTVGRSDSATDNAPLDMYDTTIMLKPREQWRPGMTYEKLIQEMDEKLQFPGLTNTWTMPVENRLDMELTGIKTPVGMKIQGPTSTASSSSARRCSRSCPRCPRSAVYLCRTRIAGLLCQRRSEPTGSGAVWPDRRGRAASGHFGDRRQEHRRKHRRPRALSRSMSATSRDFRDNVDAAVAGS